MSFSFSSERTYSTDICAPAGVYLQFKGARVANHGFVVRGDIGIHTDNSLLCVTPNNTNCCSTAETGGAPLGNWYFPNGTEVPPDSTGWLFYITRGPGVVRLHRHDGGEPGIYLCEIPDQSGVNQTLYVGLYAITSATSGEQNKMFALYMCNGKHSPCFVPMSNLWFSVDQDFLPACTFVSSCIQNFALGICLSTSCCLFCSG